MQLSVPHYLHSFSSLARYHRKNLPGISFELIEGSIVDIARVHDNVHYPGVEGADAIVKDGDLEAVFNCVDSLRSRSLHPLAPMNFIYDKKRNVYIDRAECYRKVRERELGLQEGFGAADLDISNLLEAAALISCFGFKPDRGLVDSFGRLERGKLPAPLIQRYYLSAIVSGEFSVDGLRFLHKYGGVEQLWPELYALIGLDQAKEFHPEGDVWEHSLETLGHRKTRDLELSLALLLHDLGKPHAAAVGGNRFNMHAQIGRDAARAFLRRLEFPAKKIEKICFLIENHMMPAAIKTLPTFRTEKAMLNHHFPLLLEVYRCDLMSSFNGPDGYYEACKVYRRFIKNTKNPFRDSDGKKLFRQYVD